MRRWFLTIIVLMSLPISLCVDGQSVFSVGDSLKSLGLYESAIEAYESIPPRNSKSHNQHLWSSLAECHRLVGNYQQAITYYERMLGLYDSEFEAFREVNEREQKKILLNLSGLWLNTGQYGNVVDKLENMQTDEGEDVRLVNLSSAYLRLNRTDDALALLDSVLNKRDIPHESNTYLIALQNKGYLLWAVRRYAEADSILTDVISLFKEPSLDKYICQGNLAVVEAELGKFPLALKHIDEAIEWVGLNYGPNNMDYIILVRKKAEILLQEGKKQEAAQAFKEYFTLEKQYVSDNFLCMTETERQNFWSTHSPLLAECYATEDADEELLFEVALFSKSVLMHTNLKIEQLLADNPSLAHDYARLKSLRQRQRSEMVQDDSLGEANRLERELLSKLSELKEFKSTFSNTASDVRAKLKTNDYAVEFIQYNKGDDIFYAALVMGKTMPTKFVPLFSMKELEGYLARNGMRTDDIYSMSGWTKDKILSDTLLGKKIWDTTLSAIPQNANIYFAPDGIFHLVGIEYMCFSRPDCRLYRMSSLGNLCHPKKKKIDYGKVLLVGGLDYDDASMVKPRQGPSPERIGETLFAQTGVNANRGTIFRALQGSATEIDSVATILKANKQKVFTKEAGTEDTIKVEMPNKDLLFLSTHGFCLDYKVAERSVFAKDSISEDASLRKSGLAMSGVNHCIRPREDNADISDGIITAREVCDMNLSDADLVVLSACQTGLGRIIIDGVVGLPRGFKKAGANSLLMSLWEVDDSATQLLMTEFMRNLTKGKTKHESLRKAQDYVRNYQEEETRILNANLTPSQRRRRLRQGLDVEPHTVTRTIQPYSDPQYWAAFILLDATE